MNIIKQIQIVTERVRVIEALEKLPEEYQELKESWIKHLTEHPGDYKEFRRQMEILGFDFEALLFSTQDSLDTMRSAGENISNHRADNLFPFPKPVRGKSSAAANDPNLRWAVGFGTLPDDGSHSPRWESTWQCGSDTIFVMAQPDSREAGVVQIVIWVDHPKTVPPGTEFRLSAASKADVEVSFSLLKNDDRIQARVPLHVSWSEFQDVADELELELEPK